MSIDQEKMIVEALPSLYPLKDYEEDAINAVIDALPPSQPEPLQPWEVLAAQAVLSQPDIVRCKDCKHNPKYEWFGCPMSHLSEKQRPETAWCWKAERRTDERSD